MGKKNTRRHAPISVAEAEELLAKAHRREAAQRGDARQPARVDLATLDTPDISHGEQWDDFLFRPGTFYVADIAILAIVNAQGESFTATTTFKATDEQLPYLVEVLRQVRGALGETCRIELKRAEPTHEDRRQAVGEHQHREHFAEPATPSTTEQPPAGRYAFQESFDQARAAGQAAEQSVASVTEAHRALDAARRAAAARRRSMAADGPAIVPGQPGEPWIGAEDREYSRDELAAQLPGRTRAEVAEELGKAPEDIGGTYNANVMPEELAAQLGVPVESLRRVEMTGGGHVWTVTPQAAPADTGRHAAPEQGKAPRIEPRPEVHEVHHTSTLGDANGTVAEYSVVCTCGNIASAHREDWALDLHEAHKTEAGQ